MKEIGVSAPEWVSTQSMLKPPLPEYVEAPTSNGFNRAIDMSIEFCWHMAVDRSIFTVLVGYLDTGGFCVWVPHIVKRNFVLSQLFLRSCCFVPTKLRFGSYCGVRS